MTQSTMLLNELFQLLDARQISFCVMGDAHAPFESDAVDAELIVPEALIPRLPELMDDFCRVYRVRLTQCLQRTCNVHRFVIVYSATNGRPGFLTIELRGDYRRSGRTFLRADELIRNSTPDREGRSFPVCSAAYDFILRLISTIDALELPVRTRRQLSRLWHLDADKAKTLIERFWGYTNEGRLLMRAADSGDWSAVAKLLPRMRAALHRRVRSRTRAMMQEWRRAWRAFRHPSGIIVGVLGPNGSGKSSLIAAVDRQINKIFHDTSIVQLRPGFLYKAERAPGQSASDALPRGPMRSLMRLLSFAGDYCLGYWLAIRPRLTQCHGLIFDRYYDDLLVDPLRYRHGGSLSLARRLRRVVPRPDIWLLLDATPAVLQSRKQDVSFAESERQRSAYRELLIDQYNVVVIDADRPLEKMVAHATDAILQRCEAKTRMRLGLPSTQPRAPLRSRALLFLCRHRVPILSKLTRVVFNSDILCKAPRDLHLPHPYGIVIHEGAQLGRNVTVMQQATIGSINIDSDAAPTIGDHVYVGAGARILGGIRIGDRVVIGANAVVTRDVPAGATVVDANRVLPTQDSAETPAPTLLNAIDASVALTQMVGAAGGASH